MATTAPTGPRKKGEPEVVSALEAARILGIERSNLYVVAGLPEPYCTTSAGRLWRKADIEDFATHRQTAA